MKTFKDVHFVPHFCIPGAIQGILEIRNGIELSVVAGPMLYCSPKERGTYAEDFISFEVAVLVDGEVVEEPEGWQSIEDIDNKIKTLST